MRPSDETKKQPEAGKTLTPTPEIFWCSEILFPTPTIPYDSGVFSKIQLGKTSLNQTLTHFDSKLISEVRLWPWKIQLPPLIQ